MSTYDGLDQVFDVESTEIVETQSEVLDRKKPEVQQDYEITRAQLHSLVTKGQEAIDGILDVARSSDHPRAYEVAGQLIKNVGDVTDKLIDLQKKVKDVEDTNTKTTNNVTNNAIFVGSTSELSKLLKQGFLNNKE